MILILATVVDHYGDAGVSLRLARGLLAQGKSVTLAIDRPELIDAMAPLRPSRFRLRPLPKTEAESAALVQSCGSIALLVEAFQITPPPGLLKALPTGVPRLMLDYLATEPWADDLQGMAAYDPAHPDQPRTWLAPSFSAKGYGLIRGDWRPAGLLDRAQMRSQLMHEAGFDPKSGVPLEDHFLVMGFGYEDAPWSMLAQMARIQGLPMGSRRLLVWKPKDLRLSQADFDLALQSCDLNFVRGEDSFVAAHWAAAGAWAVPFVWQPYRQANNDHANKLAGWASQVLQSPAMAGLEAMHWAWNRLSPDEAEPPSVAQVWPRFVQHWGSMRGALQRSCQHIQRLGALEDRLLEAVNGTARLG